MHTVNSWANLRFNRAACDRIWYDKDSGESIMKTIPWEIYTDVEDVLNATVGKCRRTFDYKYTEFESFW